ncbi:MAG TPA: hypothetical protein VLU99_09180 [Nitrososphaerales archaeon]|nr:hypothetical protein [Nitrososphaerales archaeon]
MSLMDRRADYSWPKTSLADVSIILDKGTVSLNEDVGVTVGFRVVGGLRESYTPNVWTMAWEDNDKLVRLMMETTVSSGKKLASTGKEVRRARFYWSRDPDLPYRIWSAIVHEDGGAPQIPTSVEDARVRFLDVVKRFDIPAKSLGRGAHKLTATVDVAWGRRTYLEKGKTSAKSKPVEVKVE